MRNGRNTNHKKNLMPGANFSVACSSKNQLGNISRSLILPVYAKKAPAIAPGASHTSSFFFFGTVQLRRINKSLG